MRSQHEDKLQRRILALEASIDTVKMQLRELNRLVSSAQLYTWRKHLKNLRAELKIKKHELDLLNPTISQTKTKRNAHA